MTITPRVGSTICEFEPMPAEKALTVAVIVTVEPVASMLVRTRCRPCCIFMPHRNRALDVGPREAPFRELPTR